ncbi:CCR4-NOT transcription complex subunit 11-like isoform X2 [Artemia franciscana]|uniref:CCR4-NOT transcription complex subunit 11-like isoform X2 n=1 Tax=Artemia franciscana TaxID=6661 RepID=UPI0032DBA11B
MSLSVEETLALLSVIDEDNVEKQTAEELVNLLKSKNFGNPFSIGSALALLLEQPELICSPGQKIACMILLYSLFKSDEKHIHPFTGFFLQILASTPEGSKFGGLGALTPTERAFLGKLIAGKATELLKKTPSQILAAAVEAEEPPVGELIALKKKLDERQAEYPLYMKVGVSTVLPMPESKTPLRTTGPEVSAAKISEMLLTSQYDVLGDRIAPEFVRLAPPLYVAQDELVWLTTQDLSVFRPLFDTCENLPPSTPIEEAEALFVKGFDTVLTLSQQQAVQSHLENDYSFVLNAGLTPEKLPGLVENNPIIAIEVLLHLMNTSQITDYLSILVNMEMSLHSMEVVNRLTSTVDLPPEFIHLYISNCISTCETIQDKYMQNRLVRLVCVFLQSLIRNKIINVQEVFIEVQSFCVQFSLIREAAALYRLILFDILANLKIVSPLHFS